MKKSLSAALLAAALCSPWVAHAEETYVKFGAGQGHFEQRGASDNESAASLAFGQLLTENLGYEIGYMHFGKLSGTETTATDNQQFSFQAQSLYAAVIGNLPLNESFSLYGKLGASLNHSKWKVTETDIGVPANVERYSRSDTQIKPMIGVGAAFHFTKQIAATVEYQHFGKTEGDVKLSAWTLGLKYGF